ncbi:uncharacterized protein LOC116854069 isoform X2 [Odontomachus brunneus]|uniref:uncharacterized protein LOC116854069 isoform X2 n=1 Tax=Odontomachus brunneus TaxID=486640 RepID=UPI0013F1A883|nr:uncharacterized protein LOC116854069 isoform X2 [Odontomachus brunneus]
MPGCAAVGCNNRSEKGYRMKCFPRDPILRKIWQDRVGRADWEPSNNSFLCHEHFESDKWCTMENDDKDDNIKTEEVVEVEYNVEKQKDEKNEKPVNDLVSNSTDNSNEDLTKPESKKVAQSVHNYDEIEEKLKQICDGYFGDSNSNNMEKQQSVCDNQKEVLQQASSKTPVHRSINYKHSSGNNIGHMLTNDTENIEIIFSAEDREESTRIRKCASRNSNIADENEVLDLHTTNIDNVNNDKEIEQNMNVTPNMMAAMKRKRKTRDEIMKSIEKSICNVSSQDTNSLSDSDIFDDSGKKIDRRKKIQKTQDESSSDASPATMKFTVKVTGHPDDVSDIMYNLSRSTGDVSLQEYNEVHSPKEDDGLVTSVITIDDCSVDVDIKTEFQDNYLSSSCFGDIAINDRMSLPSTSKNCRSLSTKVTPRTDEDLSDLSMNSNRSPVVQNATTNDCAFIRKYDGLQPKSSVQADVRRLGNQLFLCNHIEYELQNKKLKSLPLEKETQDMTDKLHVLSNDVAPLSTNVKDMQQKLIDDLTSKLNRFEETNKKLVKSATAGIEQMKYLQNQLRQRDNKIKDLTWKLNKASKILDRTQKNSITYQKKMVNMQSFLKKKKYMDDKVVQLNEILIEAIKKAYINKVLPMNIATKIKRTCGMTEYDKLLQSGLPLPVRVSSDSPQDSDKNNKILRPAVSKRNAKKMKKDDTQSTEIKKTCDTTEFDKLLQSGSSLSMRVANDHLSEHSNESNKILRPAVSRHKTKKKDDTETMQNTENHVEIYLENVESSEKITLNDCNEYADCIETVMGTVQDIFDESSDDDDFSINELTEDFILQLRKFM